MQRTPYQTRSELSGLKPSRMLRILSLILAAAWLVPEVKAQSNSQKSSRLICNAYQRQHKNCLLESSEHRVTITSTRINYFDGVHREITDLTVHGDSTEWALANLKLLGSRRFIELKVWHDIENEVGIQAFTWLIYELHAKKESKKIELVHQAVLQKRRKDDKGAIDPMVRHSFILNKEGAVVIQHGSQRKVINGL